MPLVCWASHTNEFISLPTRNVRDEPSNVTTPDVRVYVARTGFFEADQLASVLAHLLAPIQPGMTGRKTRSVFERYDIVSSGDLKAAARNMDAFSTRAASTPKTLGTGTISGTVEGRRADRPTK